MFSVEDAAYADSEYLFFYVRCKLKFLVMQFIVGGFALFAMLGMASAGAQSTEQRRASAPETLTNSSVVSLVHAGIADDAIIAKIQTAQSTHFDTSVQTLERLSKAGVSSRILTAMINSHPAISHRKSIPKAPDRTGMVPGKHIYNDGYDCTQTRYDYTIGTERLVLTKVDIIVYNESCANLTGAIDISKATIR